MNVPRDPVGAGAPDLAPAPRRPAALANLVLLVLTLASLASIGATINDYVQGMKSARALQLELIDVSIQPQGEPQIAVVLRLRNTSAMQFRLDDLFFSLFLNGDFMGSNYERWQPLTIVGGTERTLSFVIPLQPFYQRYVDAARQKGEMGWGARGSTQVVLPYREKKLQLRFNLSRRGG